MHVVQIDPVTDPLGRPPQDLLAAWWTVEQCARSVAQAGARVSVLQSSLRSDHLQRHGVDYHFLPIAGAGGGVDPGFAALLAQLRPDVIHLHGLGFTREVQWLAQLAPGVPLLLQDHAARHPRRPWLWWRWRRALSRARGVIFCARAQALPFRRWGLLPRRTRVYVVPEASSHLRPIDGAVARELTGLAGDPALLWVGHLDANKDPLAVLGGVALAARELPGLQLWMCFGQAPLRAEVIARARAPDLAGRVHLLGAVPHPQVAHWMSAADFLVQGSHREGSGYSVIEALACGLSPVVTDIPSFRSLLGDLPGHQAAALWPVGQPAALADALVRLAGGDGLRRRQQVRARFEAHCSLDALGQGLLAAYQDALQP
jgi:glycosyltransferase involved in cell wall biosynthesis